MDRPGADRARTRRQAGDHLLNEIAPSTLTGVRLVRGATTGASLGRVAFAGSIPDGTGLGGSRILDTYAFVYLVSGAGRYRDELGADHRLAAGSTITAVPGVAHTYGPEPGDAWTERYVLFDGSLPQMLEADGVIDRAAPVGRLRPVATWLPIVEAVTDPTPGGARSALLELSRVQALLAAVGVEVAAPDTGSWFREACVLLRHEPALDLAGIAAALGMSHDRFRKRFTAVAGEPPGRWRTRQRMDEAARMLQQGGWTIRRIADTLGFCDEYAFSRRFKEVMGVPPSVFRARLPGVRSC